MSQSVPLEKQDAATLRIRSNMLMSEAQKLRAEKHLMRARKASALQRVREDPAWAGFAQVIDINNRLLATTSRYDRQHRKTEARAIHLARMFLKGTPLHKVERIAYTHPQWERVRNLICLHGGYEADDEKRMDQALSTWKLDGTYVEGSRSGHNNPPYGFDYLPDHPGNRISQAIKVASRYSNVNAASNLKWVIDRMVRILAGEAYDRVVARAKRSRYGEDTHPWDTGIEP